ncbi:response regulator transcription factor [Arthrobacter sp. DNA4]|jgi:DNA-binding response OmpR family regulator|uniref:response regulator transcription factor n=1 Tax=Micrococcaceae TaxID=1268 RepID=UPI0020CF96F7|nr:MULTISPECIES: response regulator transcription factor [Micrococcaceae]UTT68520.1 response regulator transcription factor [Arthrobacter sp. DNA4]WRT12758.1 response regulator transcription factor [Pseudarthrobacter sp. LT1]
MDDLGVAVVIEDDADVRNLLEGVLTQAGFEVHTAVDGRAGVEVVRSKQANVVTLDIGLPDIDGFEVLRRIRNFSNAYVVMLTGRTEEPDLLSALNTGADDYIAKPFRPRELRARVAAMMRRPRHEITGEAPASLGQAPVPAMHGDSSVLRHNGLLLNHRTRTVEVKGEPLGLTRSEFDLLHVLLKGGGAVCTRADLVRAVRGDFYDRDTYISEADERAVEVHVGNLRRKLKEDQLSPRWLQTVRGVGYRLAPRRPDDA